MCQSTFAILVCQRHCVFLCKGTKLQNSALPNSGTVRRFPVLPMPCAKTQEFCKAEFLDSLPVSALVCVSANEPGVLSGFGSGLLVKQGFSGVKAFFAVVREGVADKPGDWLCSDSFFSLRFWGLLGSQGEPGFYFFYRDFAAPP